MLTARGWWLLMASVALAVVGVTSSSSSTVGILGLSLLAWFVFEWILFAFRAQFALPKLDVERVATQGDRPVLAGWNGRPFRVRYTVRNLSRFRCPLVHLTDCVSNPELLEGGSTRITAILPRDGEASGEYSIVSPQPGLLHFAGVHARMTDLAGFFAAEAFLPAPTTLTVLPALTDAEGRQRADKRFNTLPPPGAHRLRMPGSGSELLDLRDYRPGDPPKLIAWKPSARRDRLITKEFESEVPVRCLLLLDCGNGVRIGTSTDTPLARLATTAAGILLAATANRDLVGVTFFDAKTSRTINPARTSSHAVRMLDELAHAAAKLPEVPETDPAILVERLEPLLRVRDPKLFDSSLNSQPWSLHWRPLLDTRWGWLIFLPMLFAPVLARQSFWIDSSARAAGAVHPRSGSPWLDAPVLLTVFLLVIALPSVLASLFWLGYGLRGFLPRNRRLTRRRKQIAAIFAARSGDGPAAIERYRHDDVAFAERAGRFLADEQVRIPARRFDADGRDRFREGEKVAVAAKAIVRATTRARDNELYVVLADLLDVADDLDPLRRSIKLARSRHHHVLIIVAWPTGVPTNRDHEPDSSGDPLRNEIHRAVIRGVWRRYDKLRRNLTRSGATVLRLTDRDTIRTVLDHLDRVRGARSRR